MPNQEAPRYMHPARDQRRRVDDVRSRRPKEGAILATARQRASPARRATARRVWWPARSRPVPRRLPCQKQRGDIWGLRGSPGVHWAISSQDRKRWLGTGTANGVLGRDRRTETSERVPRRRARMVDPNVLVYRGPGRASVLESSHDSVVRILPDLPRREGTFEDYC